MTGIGQPSGSGGYGVVVIGGGFAGMAAAIAASPGSSTLLVEAGDELGGAAMLSNGSFWTHQSVSEFMVACPGVPRATAELICREHGRSVDWLAGVGVAVRPAGASIYGPRRSHRIDPVQAGPALAVAVRGVADVVVADRVMAVEPGLGSARLTVRFESGRREQAQSVVFATGGTHTDTAAMAAAGLGHYAHVALRNRPRGGDGYELARGLGAAPASAGEGIYGHLIPAGLPERLVRSKQAAQYQSRQGVLVDVDGDLVAPPGLGDHHLNRFLARQGGRPAVLVFDTDASPFGSSPGSSWASERFEFARTHGTGATLFDDATHVAAVVAGLGVSALGASASAAARDVLRTPPFHAVVVQPSLTHSGIGVLVDGRLRAVAANGEPLAGVYIAGSDIGNAFGNGYGGGLSLAISTGRVAGHNAAADLALAADVAADGHTDLVNLAGVREES